MQNRERVIIGMFLAGYINHRKMLNEKRVYYFNYFFFTISQKHWLIFKVLNNFFFSLTINDGQVLNSSRQFEIKKKKKNHQKWSLYSNFNVKCRKSFLTWEGVAFLTIL